MSVISYGSRFELGDVDNPPLSFDKFTAGASTGLTPAQEAQLNQSSADNTTDAAHRTNADLHLPATVNSPLTGTGEPASPIALPLSQDPENRLSARADGLFADGTVISLEDENGDPVTGPLSVTVIQHSDGETVTLRITTPNGKGIEI